MEIPLNTDFNLYGAIESAWHRLHDQRGQAEFRHEAAKNAIREVNKDLLQGDLNAVFPYNLQAALNISIVPALDIYESQAVFEFEGKEVTIHRSWLEKTGLYWHLNSGNYNKICLSDNLQSELFLLLANLKSKLNS